MPLHIQDWVGHSHQSHLRALHVRGSWNSQEYSVCLGCCQLAIGAAHLHRFLYTHVPPAALQPGCSFRSNLPARRNMSLKQVRQHIPLIGIAYYIASRLHHVVARAYGVVWLEYLATSFAYNLCMLDVSICIRLVGLASWCFCCR